MEGDDDHRELVVAKQTAASRMIGRGVITLAMVPIALVGALFALFMLNGAPAMIAVLLAALYTVLGGLASIGMLSIGIIRHRGATKELRLIDERHRLPPARVVKH